MLQSWTKGLDKELAEEIRMAFKSSSILRNRLAQILKDKESETYRVGRSKEGYDCPNWTYKQADASGYARALNDILSLIEK